MLDTNTNNINSNTVLAISERMAGENEGAVGAIVYWGGLAPTPLSRLAEAWQAQGLDPDLLPNRTTPAKALGVAMKELATKRLLVRPLDQRGAFALVEEHVYETLDPTYTTLLKATASKDNDSLGVTCRAGYEALGERLADEYKVALDLVPVVDMGGFVTDSVKMLHATALRPSGGIYFVPRQYTELLGKIAMAISTACPDMMVHRIPAMHAKDAIDAISAAIRAEADTELSAMETEIREFYDSQQTTIGKRALRGRLGMLESLSGKLATYESLLSTRLDELRDRMGALGVNIARGIVALEAEADEAA
jgi:hypothetical protein